MNTFGTNFRLTDFGETHGECIGGVIDGCPAGLFLDVDFVQKELDRRSLQVYQHTEMGGNARREPDKVRFVSGLHGNVTTGAPLAFLIDNRDVKINPEADRVLKPSHSSFVLKEKYGHECNEQGGRFSARQTACRVVAGAVAKQILANLHVEIVSQTESVADCAVDDTAGALVRCVVRGVPAGWGEPAYDGLDACLAASMLSIPACKGFEIGEGFAAANMCGSDYNDRQNPGFTFSSNHDGGVQAGISNGQDIVFRVAFKPIPTLKCNQQTIDYQGNTAIYPGSPRNDSSVVPRVLPVVEAMTALVLVNAFLANQHILSKIIP